MGREASATAAGPLLEAALARENLQQAWKRVKANKGSAGVDGLDIEQTHDWLSTHWPAVRHDLNCSNRPVRTRMPGGVGGAPLR